MAPATRRTRRAAALASAPASTRELASDPIRDNSSDADLALMPQSQLQSIDHAPKIDFDLRPHAPRIFPLHDDDDDDDDEILDESLTAPPSRPRKRRRPSSFAGVDSLLAIAQEKPKPPVPARRSTPRAAKAAHLKRRHHSELRLRKLIEKARSKQEVAELGAAWATSAGRRKVEALQVSSSDDEESPIRKKRNNRTRLGKLPLSRPRTTTRSHSRSWIESLHVSDGGEGEDEDEDAEHEDEDEEQEDNDDNSGDDSDESRPTRRRGKLKAKTRRANKLRKQRKPPTKSVPLPKKNGVLAERLNSRGSVPNEVPKRGRITRASTAARKEAKARAKIARGGNGRNTKRRGRSRSAPDFSDDSDVDLNAEHEEPEAAESDFSDEGTDEELINIEEVEEEEEEEEEASDDDDFVDSEPERKSKRRKGIKKNNRRKRTRPKNAFESNEMALSAREQRERLDFLVKQSADIARDLHKAMAEAASERPSAGAKSPARRNATQTIEAQTGADNATAEPFPEGGGASMPAVEEKFVPPNAKGKELQPHQTDGVNWLLALDAQGLNAILADEMGLGKTIQAVAFVASLVLSGKRGPHLVVAPKNVCEHWAAEVRAWYPGQLSVVTHLGSAEQRFENLQTILEEDNFDILVTSFEIGLRDLFTRKRLEGINSQYNRVVRAFRKVEFEYLIVDEAHRLKNDASMLNEGIRKYQCAQRRLLLTGTPLSNDLKELWSLMNVLNPKIFSSKATFEAWFSAPFEAGKGSKRGIMTHAEQSVIVDRLHTIIRPFFRRRVRADICPSFTSADEILIRCPMSKLQRALMLHFRRRADDKNASKNNILMCMRAVSSHPFISSNALFDGDVSQVNRRLVSSCGKFTFLHYSLPRLLAGGHRVLIFSQFRSALDFLEDLMDLLGIAYGRLDGLTTAEDRLSSLAEFNAPGSRLQVFLLSTRAGGVGINLQTADTVILFDSDWNPSADLQAVSRIQRIGQKKTVHIMRLVTENSVDNIILQTAKLKLRTQAVAVGAGKFNTSSGAALDQKMRQKDLEQLIQELDIKTFLPDAVVDEPASVPSSQSSPESVSPNRQQRSAQTRYFKMWSEQLLRPGETTLAQVDQPDVWIDSLEDNDNHSFPVWLGQEAVLVAAGKALDCSNRESADHMYEETVQSIARVGTFSKKDRASRARRKVSVDVDALGSDTDDNENVSEGDPSVSVEECSDFSTDEEFVPVSDIDLPSGSMPQKTIAGSLVLSPGESIKPPLPISSETTTVPRNPVLPVRTYAPGTPAMGPSKPDDMGAIQGRQPKKPPSLGPGNAIKKLQQTLLSKPVPSGSASGNTTISDQPRQSALPSSSESVANSSTHAARNSFFPIGKRTPTLVTVPSKPDSIGAQQGKQIKNFAGKRPPRGGRGLDSGTKNRKKLPGGHEVAPNALLPNIAFGSPTNTCLLKEGMAMSSSKSVTNGSGFSVQAVAIAPNSYEYFCAPASGQHLQLQAVPGQSSQLPGIPAHTPPVASAKQLWPTPPYLAIPGAPQARSQCPAPPRNAIITSMSGACGLSVPGAESRVPVVHGADTLQTSAAKTVPYQKEISTTIQVPIARALPGLSQGTGPSSCATWNARGSTQGQPQGRQTEAPKSAVPVSQGKVAKNAVREHPQLVRSRSLKRTGPVAQTSDQQQALRNLPGANAQTASHQPTGWQRHRISKSETDGISRKGRVAAQPYPGVPNATNVPFPTDAFSSPPRNSRTTKTTRIAPVQASRVSQVAPAQNDESDQGSPLYSRNPRTLRNRRSGINPSVTSQIRNPVPLGRVGQPNGIYSGSDMTSFVNSLGNRLNNETAKASCLEALVDRLREATKVTDLDFLVDALFACRLNIDDAADYIYDRIS